MRVFTGQVPGSEPAQEESGVLPFSRASWSSHTSVTAAGTPQEGVWLPVHSILDSFSTITARKQHAHGFGATRTPRWHSKAGQPHRRVPFGA